MTGEESPETPSVAFGSEPTHAPFPTGSYLQGTFFADIPARELSIAEVLPYFDWKLFYAIWGIRHPRFDRGSDEMADQVGHDDDQVVQLSADAIDRLEALKRDGSCIIRIAARFDACHTENDVIIAPGWKLPMLRQEGARGRSLADFVAPEAYGFDSPVGMFAISVHRNGKVMTGEDSTDTPSVARGSEPNHPAGCDCPMCSMDYDSLLERSLRLTLAEAASGWLDAELERQLKEQGRTVARQDSTQIGANAPVRIVKPAAGYASCPDHSLKRDILALLPGAGQLDIRLTESCAMIPDASICGLVFAHPQATYPEIRHLSPAAVDAYAALRGFSPEEKRRFLGTLL